MNLNFYLTKDYENKPRLPAPGKQTQSNPIKLEANLSLRERRSLRVSFSESSRGPIFKGKKMLLRLTITKLALSSTTRDLWISYVFFQSYMTWFHILHSD